MKFIHKTDVHPLVEGFYIDTFDVEEEPSDKEIIKRILNTLFSGKECFFILSGSEIKKMDFLESSFEAGNHIIGKSIFTSKVSNQLATNWSMFKILLIFEPNMSLSWEDLQKYNLETSENEISKMILFHFSDMIFSRGAGGESITVYSAKDHATPDLSFVQK